MDQVNNTQNNTQTRTNFQENREKEVPKTERVHRVGSITFGSVLIIFGILFLTHIFIPAMSYMMIFHLWPCILIALGIEILVANQRKGVKFEYDTAAIVLTFLLVGFAMCMAGVDLCFEHAASHIYLD